MRTSVPSLNARPALIIRLLFLAAISLPLASINVLAAAKPLLYPLPAKTIFPAQELTYLLVPSVDYQPSYAVRLMNAPSNSALTVLSDGTTEFRWTPPIGVGKETVILVQVVDTSNGALLSTQRMVLQRGNARITLANVKQAKPALEAEPVEALLAVSVEESVEQPLEVVPVMAEQAETTQDQVSQVAVNQAPTLPEIGQQFLKVGEEFQLFVRPTDPDGDEVKLTVNSLPVGAEFGQAFEQSRLLRWRPSTDQVGDHLIVLSAVDKQDATLRSDQVVVLHVLDDSANIPVLLAASAVAPAMPVAAPEPVEYVNEPSDADFDADFDAGFEDDALYIEPISSQIVSIGRVVRFPVVPRTSDGAAAILHVDRLPKNASFDENADGTRTFYWKTTASDQGSHTFRFTAIHPDDLDARVIAEAMVIVGDPGLLGTTVK